MQDLSYYSLLPVLKIIRMDIPYSNLRTKLQELSIELYKAKYVDVLMVRGASLNIECRVVRVIEDLGDHPMFIGEVLDAVSFEEDSLAYQGGKYWKLGENIVKPPSKTLEKIKSLIQKHAKSAF